MILHLVDVDCGVHHFLHIAVRLRVLVSALSSGVRRRNSDFALDVWEFWDGGSCPQKNEMENDVPVHACFLSWNEKAVCVLPYHANMFDSYETDKEKVF